MSIQKLYLELTDRCNLNCTICYRQSWQETPQDLDGEVYSRLLSEIHSIPTLQTIVFGGIGEPTCAPDFLRIAKDLQDYNLILTTNGVSLSTAIQEALLDYFDTVVISIDGMGDTFRNIRGVELKTVTDTVFQLQELKKLRKTRCPAIHLQCVLSEDTVQDAFLLVELAAELKVDAFIFSNLMPQVQSNAHKILYTRYENRRMKTLFAQLQNVSCRKGLQLVLPNIELKTDRHCSFIDENAVFISAQGDVMPCYRLSHGYTEYVFGREKKIIAHSFGNLTEHSLRSIWESDSYSAYRLRVRNNQYPSCIDCDLVDGCTYVVNSAAECWGGTPSCADCLWSRRIVLCP